jgi:uncharacterized lipoprotein YmbA
MILRNALIAGVVAALSACGSSPQANFYTLGTAEGSAPLVQSTYVVVVSPVTVPEMLERPQIVTRIAANRVTVNEFERWASPINSEIARAVAANLTQRLAGASVLVYPQGVGLESDYKVLIDVQRFESEPGDAATIEAVWQVRPASGATRFGHSLVREVTVGPGYAALVAAHTRALAVISAEIALSIIASKRL